MYYYLHGIKDKLKGFSIVTVVPKYMMKEFDIVHIAQFMLSWFSDLNSL